MPPIAPSTLGCSSNSCSPTRTSSPGSKPAVRRAAITPISLQALLEVGERLLVLEVVALEEQLDAAAEDAEGAVVLALDPVAALAGRAVDAVLGLEFAAGLGGRARGGGPRASGSRRGSRWRSSSRPSPVAEEIARTPSAPSPSRRAPLAHRRLRPPRPAAGRASTARPAPAGARGRRRRRTARPAPPRSWPPDRPPAAPGRPGGRASSSARRGRGTRARARRPRPRPRSARGCRRRSPAGPRLRSSPAPATAS